MAHNDRWNVSFTCHLNLRKRRLIEDGKYRLYSSTRRRSFIANLITGSMSPVMVRASGVVCELARTVRTQGNISFSAIETMSQAALAVTALK